MINGQNPTLPTLADPVEIDQAIQDLQLRLSTNLVWLSHGYGRAYIHVDETKSKKYTYPAIYLGKQNNTYNFLLASPDNDKTGQSFFLVDTERVRDYTVGQYNMLEYSMAIVFTVNLKLVDELLSETENFQANLIQQVRQVLTRDLQPSFYTLTIEDTKLNFKDVYREFVLNDDKVLEKAPFTHFRVNCTLLFQEQCNAPILNRCQALLNNISLDEKLNCILPTYDFSDPSTQTATTVLQQSDMINWLCTPVVDPPKYTFLFDGLNEKVNGTNSPNMQFDKNTPFSICAWVKTTNNALAQTIIAKRGVLGTNYWGLFFIGGRITLVMRDNLGNDYTLQGSTALMANTWYHFSLSYDGDLSGAGTILKVNNVLQSKTVTGMPTGTLINTQPISIAGSNSNNAFMSGHIGYVRVWNTNIVDSTIVTDYNSGEMNNNVSEQANLVLDWSSATDALFTGSVWVSKDRTNLMENPSLLSVNMEFADKTTDTPS